MSQNEEQLLRDKARADRAQQLLEDELLAESIQSLKDRYLDEWKATLASDVEGRERLHIGYNMVDQVFAHLKIIVGNGKIAAQQLDQLKKRR